LKTQLEEATQACKLAKVADFSSVPIFRHTCLTRWAANMDPYTLADLAHSDFSTTRRYAHPQVGTIREAMDCVRRAFWAQ